MDKEGQLQFVSPNDKDLTFTFNYLEISVQ